MKTGYFSHDCQARHDVKIQNLMADYGVAGLGVFWSIIETLYAEEGVLPLRAIRGIAFALQVDEAMVESIVSGYDLFVIEGDMFWSRSLRERISQQGERSRKRSEAAVKRWSGEGKCKCNASAEQKQCDPDAIKIKEKENKKEKYIVCDDNAREDFLKKFFESESTARLIAASGLAPGKYREMAEAVVDEWEAAGKRHKDWSDAATHLINHVRRKCQGEKPPAASAPPTKAREMVRAAEERRERERREREAIHATEKASPEHVKKLISDFFSHAKESR